LIVFRFWVIIVRVFLTKIFEEDFSYQIKEISESFEFWSFSQGWKKSRKLFKIWNSFDCFNTVIGLESKKFFTFWSLIKKWISEIKLGRIWRYWNLSLHQKIPRETLMFLKERNKAKEKNFFCLNFLVGEIFLRITSRKIFEGKKKILLRMEIIKRSRRVFLGTSP